MTITYVRTKQNSTCRETKHEPSHVTTDQFSAHYCFYILLDERVSNVTVDIITFEVSRYHHTSFPTTMYFHHLSDIIEQ